MNCPICKNRMKCTDSACFEDKTARRYKCYSCNHKSYTIEVQGDKFQVLELLNKKRQGYYIGQREEL